MGQTSFGPMCRDNECSNLCCEETSGDQENMAQVYEHTGAFAETHNSITGLPRQSCKSPWPQPQPPVPQGLVSQQQALMQLVSANSCDVSTSSWTSQSFRLSQSSQPSQSSRPSQSQAWQEQAQMLRQMTAAESSKSVQRSYTQDTKRTYEMAVATSTPEEVRRAELQMLRDQANALQRVVSKPEVVIKPEKDSSIVMHYHQELEKIMQRIHDLEIQGIV